MRCIHGSSSAGMCGLLGRSSSIVSGGADVTADGRLPLTLAGKVGLPPGWSKHSAFSRFEVRLPRESTG